MSVFLLHKLDQFQTILFQNNIILGTEWFKKNVLFELENQFYALVVILVLDLFFLPWSQTSKHTISLIPSIITCSQNFLRLACGRSDVRIGQVGANYAFGWRRACQKYLLWRRSESADAAGRSAFFWGRQAVGSAAITALELNFASARSLGLIKLMATRAG